jgi:hypothetical protein
VEPASERLMREALGPAEEEQLRRRRDELLDKARRLARKSQEGLRRAVGLRDQPSAPDGLVPQGRL